MKRLLGALLALLLMFTLAAACAQDAPARVYALKGPTGIGLAGVMRDHPDEYAFTLCGAADEIVAALASGSAEIGVLPEPHVTSALMQNDSLRAALDVTALFEDAVRAAGDGEMVLSMGCFVVRSAYAAEHPEQVAAFLDAYAQSAAFVNADPDAASQLVEQFGVLPKAAVARRAIPNCHIVCVTGEAMRAQIEPLYALLHKANPASVGGALPGDDFYYEAP